MKINNCFFIPARAGSKGIKNKNTQDLLGSMLFEWSFFLASKVMSHDDCIAISTDCPVIEMWFNELIKKNKDKIYLRLRPSNLCEDKSSTESAMIDTYKFLYTDGIEVSNFVLLQPTSPFRTDNILQKSLNEFYKNECLIPVFTAKKDTPFIWKNINDTLSSPDYPFNKRKMRQALNNSEYIFHEDGNVYICSVADLLANTNRLKEKSIVIENSFINSIQIDSEEDLDLCRFLSQKESISKWMTQIRY